MRRTARRRRRPRRGLLRGSRLALRLGAAATALDPAARTLTLDGGDTLPWDRLLIATGAEPRPLRVPGGDLAGVADPPDARRQRPPARRRAVRWAPGGVGAGWIGCEAAASARELGAEVTVVECADVPWPGSSGRIGGLYGDLHRERGVELPHGRPRSRPSGATAAPSGRLGEAHDRLRRRARHGVGVVPADRAGRVGGARGRRRDPGGRDAADERARRVRRRRRRQRPPPATGPARPGGALGERPQPGAVRRPQHAGRRRAYDRLPLLLLRPVRRRHGVLRPRARATTRWSSAATPPGAS